MSKECFFEILDEVKPLLDPKPNCPNYRFLSAEKKLAITLYYLKDTGTLWMTANTFGIHQCTVFKTIVEVNAYLHLPRSEDDMRKKASEFELKFGMPQAFVCIDGTHIHIKRPTGNSQDYYNYKQFFSLNVQADCDSRRRFMDVECKWPRLIHDAKVFANSAISKNLRDNLLPITYSTLLPGQDPIPNYLIGDPAYSLTRYSIEECQSCSRNSEVIFNNLLRNARNQVEYSFGRLKARYGFLRRMVDLKLETVPIVIYCCFVLHNICEMRRNCEVDEQEIQAQIQRHKRDEGKTPNCPGAFYSYINSGGQKIREVIKEYFEQNLHDAY